MIQIRRNILLFIFTLCMISCSKAQSARISASRTPIPEQVAATVAFEQTPTPMATATPEPTIGPTATPETPAGPDVNAIIMKAMSMMANVGTFHFAMDRHFFTENEADEMSVHIPVRGKFNAPDRVQGTVILTSNEKKAFLEFIIIGEEFYIREEKDGSWQMLDSQSLAAQAVHENAFMPLEHVSFENFSEPVLVGEAKLGGMPVYHVRGDVIQNAAEDLGNPGTISVDLWIGKENHLIYRVISVTDSANSDELSVSGHSQVQIEYANFGDPVLIVAPVIDDSGGFRPTGSYSTTDLLNSSPGGSNPDLPAEQTESSAQAVEEIASSEEEAPPAERTLD